MSNHISHNDPKQPCQCATPSVSKHNITPKDLENGGCGCHPQDLSPSRIDQAIEQYKKMAEEAEAARDEFLQKARALEDIAKETNATANKNAILAKFDDITIDTSTLAKDATVAKQGDNPLATNTAILSAVEQGGGKLLIPTAEVIENGVRFHFVTLAQMEKIHIRATGVGTIGFTLTKGENDFELRFSSDSPQEIAGQLIFDDSIEIVDYIFGTITIPLEGYVVSGVYIDGVDENLLEADINWRLADIQQKATGIASFFNITEATEYTALTSAEAIAIARDCQYNVMGTDWPIPTWRPTGVTEAQVESAAEGLGIPYHEPTQTA